MTSKVIPTCRYGHGPLRRMDANGRAPEWGLVGPQGPLGMAFFVSIYVCKTCGYCEFFDIEPDVTFPDEKPE